ncbi:MAG: DUF3857 domain-containing protein [Chitinophagaceae bacterium]
MKTVLLFLFLLGHAITDAQDFAFGTMSDRDRLLAKDSLDNFSNAIVLNEYGNARMYFDDLKGRMGIHYLYHVRIKILNKEGLSHANIVIPEYQGDNGDYEMVKVNKASSFNWDNGSYKESVVTEKNIYRENYSKYVTLVKFTFPELHDGTIVEYTYEKETPRIFNFQTWEFQDDIPKARSEFEAIIPANYNYNVVLRGYLRLTDRREKVINEDVSIAGWRVNSSDMTYIMENIPAFVEEDYMTAASNFKSAIYYELSDVLMQDGSTRKFTQTWRDVETTLWNDPSFGKQLRKGTYEDIVPQVTTGLPGNLTKAKAIYRYIQKQLKWNGRLGMFTETTIDDALKRHSGNVADINISLVNALNVAKIPTDVFILSTRQNGVPNKLYPILSDFNYIVARATIDGNVYLLDATDPELGFGMLPMRCLNDSGRVLPYKKASYWEAVALPQKEKHSYLLTAKLQTDGRLAGKIEVHSSEYDAYSRRLTIKNFTTLDDFVEKSLMPSLGKIKIKDYTINGLDTLDNDVEETYDFELKLYDGTDFSKLNFNPFMLDKISKNPFNLNERNYPIDLGMQKESLTRIDIEIPGDWSIESKPRDLRMVLPNRDAAFSNKSVLEGGHLMCEYSLQFNKILFTPDDYLNLKELFSRIIQLEKTDIIFKKQ